MPKIEIRASTQLGFTEILDLEKQFAAQELIEQFKNMRNLLVNMEQQITGFKHLEEWIEQLQAGIRDKLKKDEYKKHFREILYPDFEIFIQNLKCYIDERLKDYTI